MAYQRNILIITTGGTISGEVASKTKESHIQTAEDFRHSLDASLEIFRNNWNIDISISTHDLCQIDSSNMLPKDWQAMVDIIYKEYDTYDSFIIIHGTNTLGYTAAALSFALPNINKPVILTGAQVPMGYLGSDSVTNLVNSMRMASWEYHQIKGVMVVFGSQIITGTRVKKGSDFDYDPFQSFTSASLGRIGRLIKMNELALEKHNKYLNKKHAVALSQKQLVLQNNFDMRIASLSEFPGMDYKIFLSLVEQNNIQGIVFRAFGAGDASKHLIPGFEYLQQNKIPIIVTSQAPHGNSNFQVNEPGRYLKDNNLAIPAYDMSIEAMTVKLGWLLAQNTPYEQMNERMLEDLHGEINVLHDIR